MKEQKHKKRRLPLYVQILLGMVLGLIYGILAVQQGWQDFTRDWISPWGDVFTRLLQVIAVPLVLASLITGVASLKDLASLSRMGLRTLGLYMLTTVTAISLGLGLANTFQPGKSFPAEMQVRMQENFASQMEKDQALSKETVLDKASKKQSEPALQFLVDMVPKNIFGAASDNQYMLQVIFFALLMGIALMMVPGNKAAPLLDFFDSLNEVILKMVDLIMRYAPIGVTALLAGVLTSVADNAGEVQDILFALGKYTAVVLAGVLLLIFAVNPLIIFLFVKKTSPKKIFRFYREIFPAQLVAFSTSSSAATLPVTLDRVENHLKISPKTSGFVLPLGATINMDGTSLYQAIAALFIAQSFGLDLSFSQQLMVVLTAVLASIGSAAVPGAGIIMLVIVLKSVGMAPEGIALILAPDRLLDMFRTTANVTSDAMVAYIVDSHEK